MLSDQKKTGRPTKRRKPQSYEEVSEIEESSSDTETSDAPLILQREDDPVVVSIAGSQCGDDDFGFPEEPSRGAVGNNVVEADEKWKKMKLAVDEERMNFLIQSNKIGEALYLGTKLSKDSDRLMIKLMQAECCLRQGDDKLIGHIREILESVPDKYEEKVGEVLDQLGGDFLEMKPPQPFRALILFACAAVVHVKAPDPKDAVSDLDSIRYITKSVSQIKEADVDVPKKFRKEFSNLIDFVYDACCIKDNTITKADPTLKGEIQVKILEQLSRTCMNFGLFFKAESYCRDAVKLIEEVQLVESPIYGNVLHMLGVAAAQNNHDDGLDWLQKACSAKEKIKYDNKVEKQSSIKLTKEEIKRLEKQRK